jgi:hypothetical protein
LAGVQFGLLTAAFRERAGVVEPRFDVADDTLLHSPRCKRFGRYWVDSGLCSPAHLVYEFTPYSAIKRWNGCRVKQALSIDLCCQSWLIEMA